MISLPVLFNESSAVDVDNGNKVEFGRGEHPLVFFIVLQETLMEQLQADKEWDLH